MILWLFSPINIIVLIVIVVITIRLYLISCIERCPTNASMDGKVVIVTGGNNGIGFCTAKELARRSAKVILACRDETRARTARDKIISETGNKNVSYKILNLSSLASVRKFADDILQTEERIDVLINNAGVSNLADRYTSDGIVEIMQINHFSPFLLTLLLLPKLKKCKGRIINLSSICHHLGKINFDKINKAGAYKDTSAYANSKLCNIIFTLDLSERLKGSGVTVNAVHPGVISTNIMSSDRPIVTRLGFFLWCWICCRTPEEGAQTSIYLASAEEVAHKSGLYFIDCEPRFVNWKARNVNVMKELWRLSVELTGYKGNV